MKLADILGPQVSCPANGRNWPIASRTYFGAMAAFANCGHHMSVEAPLTNVASWDFSTVERKRQEGRVNQRRGCDGRGNDYNRRLSVDAKASVDRQIEWTIFGAVICPDLAETLVVSECDFILLGFLVCRSRCCDRADPQCRRA